VSRKSPCGLRTIALFGIASEVGYIEGRNAVFETRETEGRADRVDELARQLLQSKVDVIIATYPAAVLAAKRATTTTPIVMVNNPDPVHLGLVASLARPGGNITGTTSLSADLSVKQLQILKEALARTLRIAVLWNPDNPWHPGALKALHGESRSLNVHVQTVPVRRPEELDNAYEAIIKERAQAVLVLADPMTFFHRKRLAELAIKHRLPLMGGLREYTEAGGLMSYWADESEQLRNVARYVDKILKGAKPADLPIEQPSKYEHVNEPRAIRTYLCRGSSASLNALLIDSALRCYARQAAASLLNERT
jgi:putative tryptophan/tyrosine transport system substrate-binding protein